MSTMTPDQLQVALLTIELASMRNAAVAMAEYILAQPAHGMEQLSPIRRTANAVLAANGPQVPA